MDRPFKGGIKMKKATVSALCVFLFSTFALGSDYVPGEVLLKFKSTFRRDRESMRSIYESVKTKKVFRFTGMMDGLEKITLGDGVDVRQAMAELSRNPNVDYVQPNYIMKTQPVSFGAETYREGSSSPCDLVRGCGESVQGEAHNGGLWPTNPGPQPKPTPARRPPVGDAPPETLPPIDDSKLDALYGMDLIGAKDAWKSTRGSKSMIVAVIDTGIDYNHEDLAFNVWRNPDPKDGDIVGYDFIHNDGLPFDDNMHGTHTSGTVGGVGGNGVGISGVIQKVSIMGLKFLSAEGSGTSDDAIRAIDYAVSHGAKVLSNSWGGHGDDNNKGLAEAIERAREKDVLFVAAAGNESVNNDGNDPSYPAAFKNDNIIAVAATDKRDHIAYFSNYGKNSVHLAAPGVNILSSIPGNSYKEASGTSMACPHVAGAAALVWSVHPGWTYKQVKKALLDSVDVLPQLSDKTIPKTHY